MPRSNHKIHTAPPPATRIRWRGNQGRGPGGRRYQVREQARPVGQPATWMWMTGDAGAAPFDSPEEARAAAEGHAENLQIHLDAARRRERRRRAKAKAPPRIPASDQPLRVAIKHEGSIVWILPANERSRRRFRAITSTERWQWQRGRGCACEPRAAADLVEILHARGFALAGSGV